MTRNGLFEKLKRLDTEDPDAVDKLAAQISQESRQSATDLVEFWNTAPEKIQRNAAALYARLDELAIVPLLQYPELGADRMAVRARSLVDAQLETRKKIIAHLVPLLDDERLLDPPPAKEGRPVEEHPPEQRIRDIAYLQLRRLLNYSESEDDYDDNAAIFLDLDLDERDEEIEDARLAEDWSHWLDFSGDDG